MSRLTMFILTMSGIMFSQFENVCYGAKEETISVSRQQLIGLEDLWEAGQTNEYYSKARTMVENLGAQDGARDVAEVATKLLDIFLLKVSHEEQVGTENLFLMEALAKLLITGDRAYVQNREVRVRLISKFLGYIRDERVLDFEPLPVFANVSPPLGTPGMAGMRPEAIADPVARIKYEEKIRQNQQNALINRRQAALVEIERRISGPIIEYMIEIFRTDGKSSALAAECIEYARLSDDEKNRVLTAED